VSPRGALGLLRTAHDRDDPGSRHGCCFLLGRHIASLWRCGAHPNAFPALRRLRRLATLALVSLKVSPASAHPAQCAAPTQRHMNRRRLLRQHPPLRPAHCPAAPARPAAEAAAPAALSIPVQAVSGVTKLIPSIQLFEVCFSACSVSFQHIYLAMSLVSVQRLGIRAS
jgi:hypothetical protein